MSMKQRSLKILSIILTLALVCNISTAYALTGSVVTGGSGAEDTKIETPTQQPEEADQQSQGNQSNQEISTLDPDWIGTDGKPMTEDESSQKYSNRIQDYTIATAEESEEPDYTDFETGTANMPIYGVVAPVNIIDVTIPISLTFVIDSNRVFHGPENVEIISNSPAPLDTKITAINKSSNAPELVNEDKYSLGEWNNMTRTQTYKEMALSLNGYDLSEVGGTLGRLKSAFTDEQTLDLTLEAEFGKAWDNSEDISFTYNIVFELSIP